MDDCIFRLRSPVALSATTLAMPLRARLGRGRGVVEAAGQLCTLGLVAASPVRDAEHAPQIAAERGTLRDGDAFRALRATE